MRERRQRHCSTSRPCDRCKAVDRFFLWKVEDHSVWAYSSTGRVFDAFDAFVAFPSRDSFVSTHLLLGTGRDGSVPMNKAPNPPSCHMPLTTVRLDPEMQWLSFQKPRAHSKVAVRVTNTAKPRGWITKDPSFTFRS